MLNIPDSGLAEKFHWPFGVNESGDVVFRAAWGGEPAFRVVDSTGKVIRSFGRVGEGPGEFRSAMMLQVRGDTIEIFDSGRMKWLRFDWSGHLLGESSGMHPGVQLARWGDSLDYWFPPELTRGAILPVIRRRSLADTASRILIADDDSAFRAVLASSPDGKPFSAFLPYAVAADRIYLADPWHYRVFVYDNGGRRLAEFGRELPPNRRGPREQAWIRDRILRGPKFARGPDGKAIALADRSGRLDTLSKEIAPHFGRTALHVDEFGRLWVVGRSNDSTTVDVFADTTFLGRAVLPCFLAQIGWPVVRSGGWLLLECELPPEADHDAELQLYRVVEGARAQKP